MVSYYKITTKFNDLGQSLVEVLASLVIMGLLVQSLLAVYGPVSLWVNHSRWENAASNYAFAILESLRLDRNKLESSNQGKSAEELGLNCCALNQTLSNELTIICPMADDPNLYEVEVSVTWNQGGEPKLTRMGTMIRK